MKENVETYDCEESSCGRKFQDFASLLDHYKRRHPSIYKTYEKRKIFFDELTNQIENFEKEAREELIIDREREEIIEYSMIEIRDYEEENQNETELNFKETKSTCITESSTNKNKENKLALISEEMIGIGKKYADYSDIEEIDLEDKNIMCFRHKKDLNFNYLIYLTKLNLSKNFLRDISDFQKLTSIRILNISYNSIDDISSLEYLESLEVLNAESNEIRSIASLNKCGNLNCLLLANNKIMYEQSTYSTILFLKNLKELTIKNNPFLEEVIGYKHLFLNKYPKLLKLDDEDVSELDREIAKRFREGSNTNINEDENRVIEENSKQISNCRNESILNITEISNPKVKIEKMEIQTQQNILKPNIKHKSSHPLKKFILNKIPANSKNDYIYLHQIDQLKIEMNELQSEKENLIKIKKNNEIEINSLKIQLENISNMNREYEKIIEDYKKKTNEQLEKDNSIKYKQEVELWKREYFDLLNRNMNLNSNSSLSLNTSMLFFEEINPKRPHTAYNFDNTNKLSDEKFLNTKSSFNKIKNSLDDSLNNSLDYYIDVNKDIQQENRNEKNVNIHSDDEDDEIEELLRKSTSNLKSLKEEIKILNKNLNEEIEPKSIHTTKNKEPCKRSIENNLDNIKTKNTSQSKPKFMRDNIEAKIKLPFVVKNKK